ncbi:ArsR/SmtB family transcription factor [Pseudothermotoga sp. U03pept]|uniref:ArsR/SmtB family transcription factor n=1 Tax=Pseudothermotoga sp. U03pept TaxID=3447012 RepID=UPI003F112B7C
MNIENIFKALSCRWRIEIVKQIAGQDVCICDLEAMNHLDRTTISRHISVLLSAGIIDFQKDGQRKRLLLRDKRIIDLIEIAEKICEEVR